MARRNEAADEVELLATRLGHLATDLRLHAGTYNVLRQRDARFLVAMAEQLDGVALDLRSGFVSSDPSAVRGALWWVKRICGVVGGGLVGGATLISGAADLEHWNDDGRATHVFNTTIVHRAQDAYDLACEVSALPDDQLRPRPAGVTGTLSVTEEDDTSSATGVVGIADSVDSTLDTTATAGAPTATEQTVSAQPAELRLKAVGGEPSTGQPS